MSAPLRLLPLLALLAVPTSCATTGAQATAILASGQSIDAAGKTFVETAAAARDAHAKGALTEAQWRGWLEFAARFKASWTLMQDAWSAAAAVEDYATAGRLFEALGALAGELGVWIADVNAAVAAFKPPQDGGAK